MAAVDPNDWYAVSGAAHSVRAVSRGMASRGGRRPLHSRGPSTGNVSVESKPTSFAAPPRRMTLGEFQKAVRTTLTDLFGDNTDDVTGSPNPRAADAEGIVESLILRLTDLSEQVSWLWQSRESLAGFLTAVDNLQPRNRLGFELNLLEFKNNVASLTRRVMSDDIPEAQARSDTMRMASDLGPDMFAEVRRVMDASCDMQQFNAAVQTLCRPMQGAASPEYHATAVTAMLEGEARLGHLPYLETLQPEVTSKVRHILVDWMVDVAGRYRFTEETLHLSVALVDRFLGVQPISRREVQLVGVAALFLAAKYEEIYPPDVHDLVGMTANTYTKEEILHTERLIFTKLEFRVTISTSNTFAQAILAEQDPIPTPIQRHMVGYALEAVVHVEPYGRPMASELAQAAVYISRIWCSIPTPTPHPELVATVKIVFAAILRTMRMANRCPALRNKYHASRYERVSQQQLPVSALEAVLGERLIDANEAPAAALVSQSYTAAPQGYSNQSQGMPGYFSSHAQPYYPPTFY